MTPIMKLPVMTSPKAKGIFPEDNSLFLGTAAGMMADNLLVDQIMKADLVLGLGFDPVESDKIWHKDINFLSLNNYSLKYNEFAPTREVIGEVSSVLRASTAWPPFPSSCIPISLPI